MSKLRSPVRALSALLLPLLVLCACSLPAPATAQDPGPEAVRASADVRSAMVRGEWETARTLLDARLVAAPEQGDLWLFLKALAFQHDKQPAQAIACFAELEQRFANSPLAVKARCARAELLRVSGEQAAAEAIVEQEALRLRSDARQGELARIYFVLADGLSTPPDAPAAEPPRIDHGAAYQLYAAVLELSAPAQDRARALLRMGFCLENLQKWSECAGDCERFLVRFDPARAAATAGAERAPGAAGIEDVLAVRLRLGRALLRQGQHALARRSLEDLAQDVAQARAGTGAYAPVLAALDAAALARAGQVEGAARLAIAETFQTANPREAALAVAALRRFLAGSAGHPRAVSALRQIAALEAQHGRTEQALRALEELQALPQAASATPGEIETDLQLRMQAVMEKGRLLLEQKRYEAAATAFQDYAARFPSGPDWSKAQGSLVECEYQRAEDHQAHERFAEARAAWSAFLLAHPLDARAADIAGRIGTCFATEALAVLAQGAAPGAADDGKARAAELRRSAVDEWRRLAQRFKGSDAASRALLGVGQLLEEHLGDLEGAVEAYRQCSFGAAAGDAALRLAALTRPSLALALQGVWRAGGKPRVTAQVRNLEKLRLQVYKLDLETYFRKHRTYAGVENLDLDLISADVTSEVAIAGFRRYAPLEQAIELPFEGPGTWVVALTGGELRATTLVIASQLDVVVKSSPREVFVFAEDVARGEPAGKVQVLVALPGPDGPRMLELATGADGVARTALAEPCAQGAVSVLASRGGHVASVGLSLQGLEIAAPLAARALVYTDRPAYRPGQQVHWRAIVREVEEQREVLEPGAKFQVELVGPAGHAFAAPETLLGSFGTLHGELALDPAAPGGSYLVRVRSPRGVVFTGSFEVQSYQLQKVDIQFTFAKPVVQRGERIEAELEAAFYYGEPVADSPLQVALPDGTRADLRTDARGIAKLVFETRDLSQEGLLTFTATLLEEGVSRTGFVRLAQSEYSALLRVPRPVVLAGDGFEAELSTTGPDGEPLGRALVFTLLRRESSPLGTWSEVELSRQDVVTDPKTGRARVPVVLERGGQHVLRAEALDRFGAPVVAQASVLASGDEDDVRLRLIAADGEVEVGGQARLQIVNRSGAGLALLTLEADGVLEHRLLRLAAGTSSVEVALDERAFPGVWVAIARMDGSRLHEHSVGLSVVRRLDLAIEALEKTYEPGARARLRVSAKDQLGRPVQAELSIAVVDESLYDLYPDRVAALATVFGRAPRRASNMRSASSCTLAYSGTTTRIAAEVLNEERAQQEQAQWAGRAGQVREQMEKLTVKSDESYRGVGDTVPPAAPVADAEVGTGFAGRKVGGGRAGRAGGATKAKQGQAEETGALPETETAFWTATLLTGADGTATAEFELPGQSTRWRATCRGVGPGTLVGEASTGFRTQSELFLELRTPPQLVEGDRPRFVARVHNSTGTTGTLELALRVQAGETRVTLPCRLELGASPVAEHVFEALEALPACGTLKLQLEGKGTLGGRQRALASATEVAVRPWGIEGAASASGALVSSTVLELELDPTRGWKNRTLEIRLGPGLQQLLVDEALGESDGLAQRAGCLPPSTLADAASHLFGLVQVLELDAAAGGTTAAHARLLARAQSRIVELVAAQHSDGGWGWSRGAQGEGHVETSCLALAALARAAATGLGVPPATLQGASTFLNAAFRNAAQRDDEQKALIVWALAVQGSDDFAAANRLHRDRASLSPAALSYTALALLEMERAPMAAEVAEALALRLGDANRSWNASPTEKTALAAYALGRALPGSPRLQALVDELLAARPWNPARARGFALAALAWHVQHTRPAQDRSSIEVRVEGQAPQRVALDPDQPGATLVFAIPEGAPRKLRTDLVLTGGGRPHYAAVLRGFSPDTSAKDSGALQVSEQREIAVPPVYRGREIQTGFGVVRNARPWTNTVEHLPLGAVATCRVQVRPDVSLRNDERNLDYLVLEVPLPAGTRILEESLRGLGSAWRIVDGRLIVELGQRGWFQPVEFRLLGTLPGRYRVPPAILRSAYDPARRAIGRAHEFEVLASGETSTDKYEPTPDELFYLGQACYLAGERERARTLLEKLYETCAAELNDQPLREAAEMLLYLSIDRDEPRPVVRYFEVLKEKNPDLTIPFEKILAVGAAYRRLGEHERALLIFKATIEETFGKDLKVLGALDAAKDADAALRTFARLLRDYPDFPGTLEAELALSDRLLKLAPRAGEDATLRKAGRDRAALTLEGVQLLQRFLSMHPRDPLAPQAGLNLVNAFLAIEDYERTAQLGRELAAVYTEPRYADAFLYAAAVADWYRGQDKSAEDLLGRIAASTWKDAAGVERRSPNRELALYILAQIHHARREFGSAAEYYTQVENLFADAKETLLALREKTIALPEVTSARPGEPVEVVLTHRNVARAEVLVYPVDLMTLYLREKTLANVAGIELAGISPAVRKTVELGQDSELRAREQKVALELTKPGAYLVIARGDEQHATGLVLVSNLDLEVREDAGTGRLRIQVLDHAGAGYVRGADVKVVGSASQSIVAGKTDPRGLFVAEGVAGTSTVIARLGEREYAFFRGQRVLGAQPDNPNLRFQQLDQQSYLKNFNDQNDLFQNERESKLQSEIQRDRKGVQVRQVK